MTFLHRDPRPPCFRPSHGVGATRTAALVLGLLPGDTFTLRPRLTMLDTAAARPQHGASCSFLADRVGLPRTA